MSSKKISNAAIEITGLSKTYAGSSKPALNNLSLRIYPGEVYGFLGPNGSGKSTTIRMLLNFIRPSKGSAKIRGLDAVSDSLTIRRSVGYLSGDVAMYPKMTGRQFLAYMCDLQGEDYTPQIKKLAKQLDADLNKKLNQLSRGNRQKIALIQAFMHKPAILILDEPTSGLDPLVQETFQELVIAAKKRGAAIFMSSHVLSEVQKMCDRVGIIREGELVSENVIADMSAEAAQTFEIVFADKVPLTALNKVKGAKVISHTGKHAVVHMHGKLSPLLSILAKYDVQRLDAKNLDLEESFMSYYAGKENKK